MKTKTQEQLEKEIEEFKKNKGNYYWECEKCNHSQNYEMVVCLECNSSKDVKRTIIRYGELDTLQAKLSQHLTDIKNFEKLIDKLELRRRRNWKFGQVVEYGVLWKDVEKIKEALKNL